MKIIACLFLLGAINIVAGTLESKAGNKLALRSNLVQFMAYIGVALVGQNNSIALLLGSIILCVCIFNLICMLKYLKNNHSDKT